MSLIYVAQPLLKQNIHFFYGISILSTCMYACQVHVHRGQKKASDPPELSVVIDGCD